MSEFRTTLTTLALFVLAAPALAADKPLDGKKLMMELAEQQASIRREHLGPKKDALTKAYEQRVGGLVRDKPLVFVTGVVDRIGTSIIPGPETPKDAKGNLQKNAYGAYVKGLTVYLVRIKIDPTLSANYTVHYGNPPPKRGQIVTITGHLSWKNMTHLSLGEALSVN